MSFQGLTIGVPKEVMQGERRVAATPATVKKMREAGGRVLIEAGAGIGSHFSDEEYKAAGAELVAKIDELIPRADLIIKVKEPQFRSALGKHEIDMMKSGQCIVTFLHPANPDNHDMIRKLAARGVTGLTLDSIPRTSRAQPMDALTSMSTVAGYKAVLMAANRLPKFMPMVGTAVGTLEPAKVLILGAGVAGLQAMATAKRLGAVLFAADIREEANQHAKSLGAKLIDLKVPAEIAVGEGGYAKTLPEEWVIKEREILAPHVAQVDIVIMSALIPGKIAPILITEEMVKSMKSGSAIVDISIDQGGNCAITEHGQVCEKHGVSIDGTKNIPGMVPTASTWMFSNNILNYIVNLVREGRITLDMSDDIIASSLVTRDGKIVHAGTLEAMGN
jgi:H+-translocating NAD(P) transhydrogenase subunit alpha